MRSPRWRAADERILGALVQSTYLVAVEFLLVDRETGISKQLGWKLLDREPDGVGSAGKSAIPDRLSPDSSAPGLGRRLLNGPGRDQFRRCGIVEHSHCG